MGKADTLKQILIGEVPTRLATVSGIDLKVATQTNLYTCPTGKVAGPIEILLYVQQASSVTVAPAIRIGLSPNYNEWLPNTVLTGLNAAKQFVQLSKSGNLIVHQILNAGSVLSLDVVTPATATALKVRAYVFGFLI